VADEKLWAALTIAIAFAALLASLVAGSLRSP
jgi:hypothetical protein